MDNTRKINTTITTRYDKDHQDVFKSVLDLVNQNDISKSKAQLLLVERGLVHTNNPEPLIKEVEKVVYRDRPPVEKVVYRDKPKDERIIDTKSDQANQKGQRASDDKLTNPNKAKSGPASSKLALEEKKSSNDSNIGSWIVGLSVVGVIIYGLIKS
ncbi:hypothetical protein ES705_49638 [subsurface metagenome]|jgi:hypothetical protein